LNEENVAALDKGFANLERHVRNVRDVYRLPCVVSINHFTHDTDAELKLLQDKCAAFGVPVVVARHWAQGGAGAEALAEKVVELADSGSASMQFVYEDDLPLLMKIEAVARKVYGAASIKVDDRALHHLDALEREGYGHFPVCIAKTQYSFSSDAGLRGAPDGHTLAVREIRLSAGAEFVVAICGEIMTMPGLHDHAGAAESACG
jgi:formate--tetrahydrofolate ligase